jgi:DNA-binding transcriptional MocR family regulator
MHRMAEAAFEERVAASCAHYRRRRDAMLAALARHMPKGVSWTEPKGGLFTWLRLPEGQDGAALLTRSLAEAKVAFVPGSAFFFDDRARNTARLSYSLPGEDKIEEGIARLARLV